MSVDQFFSRRYRRGLYNCAHFACDVWAGLGLGDISEPLRGLLTSPARRRADFGQLRRVTWLARPVSPCLVWFQRPREAHVGVFYEGKVLHLLEHGGVQYMPLHVVSIGFGKVRFFNFK